MYVKDFRRKTGQLLGRDDLSWFVPFAIIGLTLLISWSIAPATLLSTELHVSVWLAITAGIMLPALLATWMVLCWFPVMDVLHNDSLTKSDMWIIVAYIIAWPASMTAWLLFAPFILRSKRPPSRQR